MTKQLQDRRRLIRRIEPVGRQYIARIARHVTAAGVQAVRTGHAHVDPKFMQDQLVELMLGVYVKAWELNQNALKLSFVSDVRKVATRLGLDLGDLDRSFRTLAGARIGDAAESYNRRINAKLQEISAEQLSSRAATMRMRQELTGMGLSPTRPSLPTTLTHSHMMQAYGISQYKSDRELDKHSSIGGYEFSATMDSVTDPECEALNGHIFTVEGAAAVWPPLHWNCRCHCLSILGEDVEPTDSADAAAAAVDPDFHTNPADFD